MWRAWEWVERNPDDAWRRMMALLDEGRHLEASGILEALIDQHAPRFLDRIAEAAQTAVFAELVVMAHVGDSHGPGVDEFRLLQQRLARSGT